MIEPADSLSRRERVPVLVAAGALVLAAGVLWGSAPASFFNQDDFVLLDGARRLLSQPGAWHRIFTEPGIMDGAYRPLSTYVYFGIMQRAFGLDPLPFHLVSLLVHLGCGLALFRLMLGWRLPWPAAAFGALFLLTRDASFAAVHWISGIQDLSMTLCAILSFGALGAYLRGRGLLWLAASAALFAAGLLCKETALALLPLFPLAAFLWPGRERRRRGALVPALVGAPYFVLRFLVIGHLHQAPVSLSAVRPGALLRYLAWMIDSSRFDPPSAVGLAVLALLLGWVLLTRLPTRAGRPGICTAGEGGAALLGAAWTLLALLPPIALREHSCQYYVYLPSAGLALFLGSLAAGLVRRLGVRLAVVFLLAASVLICAGSSRIIQLRAAGMITPGSFYHPLNAPVNRAFIETLIERQGRIPDDATVYLAGYPPSYVLEGPTWRAIARLYFAGRFTVTLEINDPAGARAPGAVVLDLREITASRPPPGPGP